MNIKKLENEIWSKSFSSVLIYVRELNIWTKFIVVESINFSQYLEIGLDFQLQWSKVMAKILLIIQKLQKLETTPIIFVQCTSAFRSQCVSKMRNTGTLDQRKNSPKAKRIHWREKRCGNVDLEIYRYRLCKDTLGWNKRLYLIPSALRFLVSAHRCYAAAHWCTIILITKGWSPKDWMIQNKSNFYKHMFS